MLFCFELKKMLFTRKGLFVLVICLVLKTAFLFAFPKLIDERIRLSRKQYDKILDMVWGESSDEKDRFLIESFDACKAILDSRDRMQEQYRAGEITEEEWQEYCTEYDQANLHENALEILHEKAEAFSYMMKVLAEGSSGTEEVDGDDSGITEADNDGLRTRKADGDRPNMGNTDTGKVLSRPWYMDEYGWQTVFTLLRFPDVFLLVFVLLAAVQAFSAEDASGMLPILMSSAKGRRELYLCKVGALTLVTFAAAVFGGVLELLIFQARGFLADGGVPLYSITIFSKTWLNLSLLQGYYLCLFVRCVVLTMFSLLILGISVWIRGAGNLIMLSLMLLVIPFLFLTSRMALFTYSVLISGTEILKLSAASDIPVKIPAITMSLCSILAVILGMMRYTEG